MYEERVSYMQNAHQAWGDGKKWWTDPLPATLSHDRKGTPFLPGSKGVSFPAAPGNDLREYGIIIESGPHPHSSRLCPLMAATKN